MTGLTTDQERQVRMLIAEARPIQPASMLALECLKLALKVEGGPGRVVATAKDFLVFVTTPAVADAGAFDAYGRIALKIEDAIAKLRGRDV